MLNDGSTHAKDNVMFWQTKVVDFSETDFFVMKEQIQRANLVTLLDDDRLRSISAAMQDCLSLEGDVVECGSYKGGSAGIIAQVMRGTGKTLHVCDSFCGLPEESAHDNYYRQGWMGDTNAETVRRGLSLLDCAGFTRVHAGFFSDTFPQLSLDKVCFAHIDVDIYQSAKECLEFLYPKMVAGGIMIFDDYDWHHCLGNRKAIDDFFADKPETPEPFCNCAWHVRIAPTRA